MKDRWKIWAAVFLMLMVSMFIPAGTVQAEESEDEAEWTVLFYFCGSDLESKYGFATENLSEINECWLPQSVLPEVAGEFGKDDNIEIPGKVNILVQTGGCMEWKQNEIDMEIASDRLQRWKYGDPDVSGYALGGFLLEQELPLASMADPGTLTDFITWGAENFPAKRYALVLWDHGGGSKSGIFIDELFQGDVMYLDELGSALSDSGVHFEAVLLDACMMANLETACAIRDSASWMIASEEVVPGKGTAISAWLQELLNNPECDGERLGRCVCDMTQIKYANNEDKQARSILTWSVIDLSKIEKVAECFDRFFQTAGSAYLNYPGLVSSFAMYVYMAEEFGNGTENMRDIAEIFYISSTILTMDVGFRREMLDALEDAVVYNVKGAGRSAARGLSFCYATNFSKEELDIYARNCPSKYYLAFLDAVSEWSAPEEIYETVQRLPEIDTLNDFQITVEKETDTYGIPGFQVKGGVVNINAFYYRLYKLDEKTGEVICLGRTPCMEVASKDESFIYSANNPTLWPAVEGQFCTIELISEDAVRCLYNIPVQIDGDMWYFRCGRDYKDVLTRRYYGLEGKNQKDISGTYVIYGLWEGYDDDSIMPGRNVVPLSQKAGEDYCFLYPVDTDESTRGTSFQTGETMTLYRSLEIGEKPLPAGTYYLEYEIDDMFMRPNVMERIEMHWDGENLTFPEDFKWEGTVSLNTAKDEG